MVDDDLEHLVSHSTRQKGKLKKLMGNCPLLEDSTDQLHLLFPKESGQYSLHTCAVGREFFEEHRDEGCFVRGSKEEIIFELTDEVREQADEEGLEL